MEQLTKTIEAAYHSEITMMYKTLSQGVLAAAGDAEKITEAQGKFKKELSHAAEVRNLALEVTGAASLF